MNLTAQRSFAFPILASSLGRRLDAGAAEPLQEGDQVRAAGAVLDVERVRLLAPPPWIEERFHGRNGSVVQEERLAGQIDEERRWNTPAGASVTGIHHDQLVVVLARRIGQWGERGHSIAQHLWLVSRP